jgi:hypothetical protein
MLYFNNFFFVFRIHLICTKQYFFLIAENDICKLFFLGLRIILFPNADPLQSSGIVDGEIFYSEAVKRILGSICEFREYAKSGLSFLEITAKVFNRIRRMSKKSFSVHGYYDDFREVYSEYAKSILPFKGIWRRCQEWFAVYGEYANRHKNELISANFFSTKTEKISDPKSHYWTCSKGQTSYLTLLPL